MSARRSAKCTAWRGAFVGMAVVVGSILLAVAVTILVQWYPWIVFARNILRVFRLRREGRRTQHDTPVPRRLSGVHETHDNASPIRILSFAH